MSSMLAAPPFIVDCECGGVYFSTVYSAFLTGAHNNAWLKAVVQCI